MTARHLGLPTVLLLAACAAPHPAWPADATATLAAARAAGDELVVFFALPGREQSDRMEQRALRDPQVLAALADGGFRSLWLDGFTHRRLHAEWLGGGEGMGVCVLDGDGAVYAARPGPQDPGELAAFVRLCTARRGDVRAARARLQQDPGDPRRQHELALLLLELGCRVGTEELLMRAAQGGEVDAHHRLARLFALDGHVQRARQWLRIAVPSPAARVTEGYVLFKERRHADAAAQFEQALALGDLGPDRDRARLYYGKALHECGRDDEARAVLEALRRDAAGTTFGAAAEHTLGHMQEDGHDHSH
ncbi:MAG: tetratricopeptide repeat protein [Planctomycetota bacterium]